MSLNFEEFNSVVKIFDVQSSFYKDSPYLWRKQDDKYQSLSWTEVRKKVETFSSALKSIGILEGDRIVIVSENRPEWQIADLSIMTIGAITVPAYTTSTSSDYEYIIQHSGARCVIVSSDELTQKVIPAVAKSPQCQNLIKIELLLSLELKNMNKHLMLISYMIPGNELLERLCDLKALCLRH